MNDFKLLRIECDKVVLSEYHKGAKSSHYWFVKTPNDAVPVHVSSFIRSGGSATRDILIQYEIPLAAFERFDRVEFYFFSSSNKGPLPPQLYVLRPKQREVELAAERLSLFDVEVSSGSEEVDSVMREIAAARDYWSNVFCKHLLEERGGGEGGTASGTEGGGYTFVERARYFKRVKPERLMERRRYALAAWKATYAYDYFVRGTMRRMWGKLAKEYQSFALALIHEVLSSMFELDSSVNLTSVCVYLTYKRPFSWSGPLLKYSAGGGGVVAVELEPRPSWADLAIVAEAGGRRRTLLVECKQGPPELWLEKALKQSRRYRAAGAAALLLALRQLHEEARKTLLHYYNYVIDGCAPTRCCECKRELGETLDAWLSRG
jgi:hypothetical protein